MPTHSAAAQDPTSDRERKLLVRRSVVSFGLIIASFVMMLLTLGLLTVVSYAQAAANGRVLARIETMMRIIEAKSVVRDRRSEVREEKSAARDQARERPAGVSR